MLYGLPSTIRTCDLRLRRALLYPAELWAVHAETEAFPQMKKRAVNDNPFFRLVGVQGTPSKISIPQNSRGI